MIKNFTNMKTIHLFNRDEADLNLVSEDDVHWFFEVDDAHKYILEYMRIGLNSENENSYTFVDPAGGPFLSVGDWFDSKHQIDKITHIKGKGYCIITNNIIK